MYLSTVKKTSSLGILYIPTTFIQKLHNYTNNNLISQYKTTKQVVVGTYIILVYIN